MLRLCVDDIRVFGIHLGFETITSLCGIPIRIYDSMGTSSSRRASQAVVVLCSAIDKIKRLCIIDRNFVELGDRKIWHKLPCFAPVKGFIDPSIAADKIIFGIVRIDPHGMVVHMFAPLAKISESLASVVCDLEVHIHRVYSINILGIAEYFLIVISSRCVAALFLPGSARICASIESSFTLLGFNDGVYRIGINGGNR